MHTYFQRRNFYQLWCGAVFISTTQLCQIKPEPRFCALSISTNFWKGRKVFNLFRLLECETLKISSIRERRKSRHKFGGTKVCKAEEVRKYFVNPKVEIKVLCYITCSLDFKNISCTLFSLHMKTMNGVVSSYILLLALHHLFHFIACVSFLSIFSFFLVFLWVVLLAEVLR